MEDQELSEMEKAWIDAYFSNRMNATAASRAVKKLEGQSAMNDGYRMLQRSSVREVVDRRFLEWRAKHRMTVEQIGDLFEDFSKVDLLEIFNEDGDLRPLSEIPPHARRCIASIEVERRENMVTGAVEIVNKKIKLVDRKGAGELLGKYRKMFTENLDVTSGGKPLMVSVSISGQKKEG